ncbi:TonB-dependent siderophore receptor [Acidisoma cellulosilytica]|uniref:TonB-dependent siderophore receptor n=1 Tax=Acidisoma cellulosilyticum TaxID=2802395 RepID=A0A963YZ27_9PROT|nr:TonB-dependent siderophore receptor [Acidisoma cellulosilyticum]MCB8879726.1 TonB-dependent siderophore receptor [Acidisoma cellulosilyticum]
MTRLVSGRFGPLPRQSRLLAILGLTTALSCGLIVLPSPLWAQGVGQATAVDIAIAAQPLDQALRQLMERTGLQIAYTADLTAGKRSTEVHGRYNGVDALGTMLTGTGLIFSVTGTGVVRLDAMPQGSGASLPPVTVVGSANSGQSPRGPGVGYVATRTDTGTKSNTPIREVPQAISVVTRQQMDDQDVQSVRQALFYTSGVDANTNGLNGDSFEQIYGRGFLMQEFLDGMLLPHNAYNTLSIDPYDLERIEVLHGPASVLYGSVSPGGMVNLVSKTPTETPQHEVYLQGGSPEQIGGGFDLSGPVDGSNQVFYRLVGSALAGDTQVNGVDKQRISIAPSITYKPDADTSFTILGRYQYDPKAGYYNNLPAQGTVWGNPPGQIPVDLNPGDPNYQKYSKREASIGYLFDHRFDDVWSVHQSLRYTYDQANLENVFAYGITSNGQDLERYAFANDTSLNQFTVDTNAQAKFSTGPLRHTITAGLDYQRIFYKETYGNNFDEPDLDIFAPVYNQAINPVTAFTTDTELQQQMGLYAQDQMRIGHLALLIGGRNDWATTAEHDETDGSAWANQSDTKFTWRVGAVYLMNNGISPYASYSTSFQPEVGTGASGNAFKPTTGQQYEVGVKYQPPGYNSFVTAALFNLTQQNVLTTDPTNSNFETQTGEIRSRGLELEGHASLTDSLNLILSYTYLDAVVTKSNTTSGAYTYNVGDTPDGVPSNMASVWANYLLPWHALRGITLGGGLRYVGSTYGDDQESFSVHAVTLLDAAVNYDLSALSDQLHGLSFQLNGSNLLNTTYVAGCTSDIACTYGLRRVVLGSLKYKW